MGHIDSQLAEDRVARATFARLFEAHHADLLRYAERRVDHRHAAEDIVGSTFELAWIHLTEDQSIERPWLFVTTAFKIRDYKKRRTRQHHAEAALTNLAEHTTSPDLLDALALHEALRALSEREQIAVELTYWQGRNAVDIARELGVSRAAVWMLLSRARTKLRSLLSVD